MDLREEYHWSDMSLSQPHRCFTNKHYYHKRKLPGKQILDYIVKIHHRTYTQQVMGQNASHSPLISICDSGASLGGGGAGSNSSWVRVHFNLLRDWCDVCWPGHYPGVWPLPHQKAMQSPSALADWTLKYKPLRVYRLTFSSYHSQPGWHSEWVLK